MNRKDILNRNWLISLFVLGGILITLCITYGILWGLGIVVSSNIILIVGYTWIILAILDFIVYFIARRIVKIKDRKDGVLY